MPAPQQMNSVPSTDFDPTAFDAAFGDALSADPTPKSVPSPKMEEDEEEFAEEGKTNEPPQSDPLDEIERKQQESREKWKLQKEIKDLKAKLAENEAKASKGIDPDSDNPLREIAKLKKWNQDDVVAKALEIFEDEGLDDQQAKSKVDGMSYEEIVKKVKEDLKKEQEEENAAKSQKEAADKAVNTFKEKIKTFATESADKYPLIADLGGIDAVYSMIENDYFQKEKEFDSEYAAQNLMTIEEAAKKVNERLASSVKDALKSKQVRNFIISALKEDGGGDKMKDIQLEDFFQLEEPSTLTNATARKITDPKDQREMTDEERFKNAFAYLE